MYFLPFLQTACIAAGAEKYLPEVTERFDRVEAAEAAFAAERSTFEATLAAERAALAAEKEKGKIAARELELAKAMVANKERDLEVAIRAKLEAQAELETTRVALTASQAEGQALAEAQKNADNEFDAASSRVMRI